MNNLTRSPLLVTSAYLLVIVGCGDDAEERATSYEESSSGGGSSHIEVTQKSPIIALHDAESLLFEQIGERRLQEIIVSGAGNVSQADAVVLGEAFSKLKVAADAGISNGQFLLGLIGPIADRQSEFGGESAGFVDSRYQDWLKKAAKQDHIEANYVLGLMGIDLVVPTLPLVSDESLYSYMLRAAELGHEDAVTIVETIGGSDSVSKQAADGDPAAKRQLAVRMLMDYPDDEVPARQLMLEAADGGDVEAMIETGVWFWGRENKTTEKYLRMATEHDNERAHFALGNFYACVGKSQRSEFHFREAMKFGHVEAKYALADLSEWGIEEWDCQKLT